MADRDALCPRCLEFEDEIRALQQRLAAAGQYVTFSPGPNPGFNVERELHRWLASTRVPTRPPASAPAGGG